MQKHDDFVASDFIIQDKTCFILVEKISQLFVYWSTNCVYDVMVIIYN